MTEEKCMIRGCGKDVAGGWYSFCAKHGEAFRNSPDEQAYEFIARVSTETPHTCLTRATALVDGPRQSTYGPPHKHFAQVADLLNGLLGKRLSSPIEARDIPLIMICLKMARLTNTPDHTDTIDDIAGYIRTYEMVLDQGGE
jgi:hypothetical protein